MPFHNMLFFYNATKTACKYQENRNNWERQLSSNIKLLSVLFGKIPIVSLEKNVCMHMDKKN